MKKPLLTYEIKTFRADGTEIDAEKPEFYRAADPETFKEAVRCLFGRKVFKAGGTRADGYTYEDWMLPTESPAMELWNGGECALRIAMDMDYLAERTDPHSTLHYDLMCEYQRGDEGFYFDVFKSPWSLTPNNPCEAEYMAMFDGALLEYERRTEPGDPIEIVWQPELHLDGFYRPLELADLHDFAAEQGELHDWYRAPYQLVWDKNNWNRPYGAGLPVAAKAGTVKATMGRVEAHARQGEIFTNLKKLSETGAVVAHSGRDNCVMHLVDHWDRFEGYGQKIVTVFAEVFDEKTPDYGRVPEIVKILDKAIARFEKNKAVGKKSKLRKVFV